MDIDSYYFSSKILTLLFYHQSAWKAKISHKMHVVRCISERETAKMCCSWNVISFDYSPQTGRPEMVVGWYHSHPGFGCWLSGVDINTQQSFEALSERAVAVVVDPIQSVKGNKTQSQQNDFALPWVFTGRRWTTLIILILLKFCWYVNVSKYTKTYPFFTGVLSISTETFL